MCRSTRKNLRRQREKDSVTRDRNKALTHDNVDTDQDSSEDRIQKLVLGETPSALPYGVLPEDGARRTFHRFP